MAWRTDSLERSLIAVFAACVLLQLLTCALLLAALPAWQVGLLALAFTSGLGLLFGRLYRNILTSFRRASMQMDALTSKDYGVRARPAYRYGAVAELHRQLDALADSLRHHRRGQDEQALLLYRLIDQLNAPILIFNERLKLSYANPASAGLFERPREMLRNISPPLLGLVSTPQWRFADERKAGEWQIRHSLFWDQGHCHQMLVFINIQTALRESQLQAWQKLIRVLSHEIRNSLTPVVALVQNLQPRARDEREQQALQVIDERCRHLQDFVRRYAEVHAAPVLKQEWIRADAVFRQLADLFPAAHLKAVGARGRLWADGILLQQVLINLVTNAQEAGSEPGTIRVVFSHSAEAVQIRIVDRGRGIARHDDLFVPFYSTKPQGQGIGLSLSRHFIEQMGGELTLGNNPDNIGACATIRLPPGPISEQARPDSDPRDGVRVPGSH